MIEWSLRCSRVIREHHRISLIKYELQLTSLLNYHYQTIIYFRLTKLTRIHHTLVAMRRQSNNTQDIISHIANHQCQAFICDSCCECETFAQQQSRKIQENQLLKDKCALHFVCTLCSVPYKPAADSWATGLCCTKQIFTIGWFAFTHVSWGQQTIGPE